MISKNYKSEHKRDLSDAARERVYRDIELNAVHERFTIGTTVSYSSVGEAGVTAGLGENGTIINIAETSTLVKVDWEKSEPSWIDARVLIKLENNNLSCNRCGHIWFPRSTNKPKWCPKCNSPYWDKLRRKDTARRNRRP